MLAYVFWHWPAPSVDATEYASRLAAFHARLYQSAPTGLRASAVFTLPALPCVAADAPPEPPYFEDWYLIDDFAALGALNTGAVSPANHAAHDDIARLAAGGTAGLYAPRIGKADPRGITSAAWFGKPIGMPYDTLLATMRPLVERHGGTLWQRQMVLGTTSEFCWWSASEPALPADLRAHTIALTPLVLHTGRDAI